MVTMVMKGNPESHAYKFLVASVGGSVIIRSLLVLLELWIELLGSLEKFSSSYAVNRCI